MRSRATTCGASRRRRRQGSPASVDLGGAGAFAVLAGSTVTSTGATALTGDLGVSPGTAVHRLPARNLHRRDHTLAMPHQRQAMTDLTTAYNDAAGRTVAPVTVAGNLGGLTLPPGLYKSTSSLAISSGDLTLDAQGDANAVFIFQMASTPYHDIRPGGDLERRRQVFKRLLAGGEFGDAWERRPYSRAPSWRISRSP